MAKDELFTLIQSLSVSELRYFRMQARQHSADPNQKYLRLFDAMQSMEEYSLEALREKCKGESFLDHLPSARRYLFGQLVRALRNYHHNRSLERRLRAVFDEIEILYERGLVKYCSKRLRFALQLAREHQLSHHLLQCLRWERRLLKTQRDPSRWERMLAIEEEEKVVLAQLQRENLYVSAYDREFMGMPGFDQLDPPRQSGESFYGLQAYLGMKAIHAQRNADIESESHHFQEIYDLFRNNPHQIEAYPLRFLHVLRNVIQARIMQSPQLDIKSDLQEMRKIQGLSASTFALIEPELLFLEILHYLNQRNFSVLREAKERLEDLVGNKNNTYSLIIYQYNIALADFFLEDYKTSKKKFETLMEKQVLKLAPAFYHQARTFQILMAVLLKQDSILTYYTRSAKRFYRNRSDQPPYSEPAILMATRWNKLNRRDRIREIEQFAELVQSLQVLGKGELVEWTEVMKKRLEN